MVNNLSQLGLGFLDPSLVLPPPINGVSGAGKQPVQGRCVKVDRAYCLPCYMFRDQGGNHGTDAFVTEGFNSWSKKDKLTLHQDLVRQNQSIVVALHKQTELMKTEYHMRLNASIKVCRYLLKNALPFCGNDESEKSMYKGIFLWTLKLIGRINGDIEKVMLQNAPKNNQITSPKIQKDLVTCFAEEVLKSITREIGDDVFALLVDESSDVSRKEQMVVVLRFVDKVRVVQERFIGVVHVMDTSALSLKYVMDALFSKHGLSFKKVKKVY
ncbi:uncharacterized protein LOC112528446 [Cynara cardunculus var. scolymus]|uniref:uncharacterized protein LOC112528446 n=1 Tax=Cynara cardunculus var. scolymus TaxID=59895 RepID=UPI000D6232DD|nr:uncharacterized protein LOC112528446 [Cynara cardunculus var. scolymus]